MWFLRYGVRQTEFLSLWTVFWPPYPTLPISLWTQKIKILEKQALEDIIILQMFTLNDSHMIYGFSDMECNRQKFLSFWTVFCPFTPLITQVKKPLEITSFYNNVPKIMILCYTVPEIWCVTYVIIFHFGSFFALLPP